MVVLVSSMGGTCGTAGVPGAVNLPTALDGVWRVAMSETGSTSYATLTVANGEVVGWVDGAGVVFTIEAVPGTSITVREPGELHLGFKALHPTVDYKEDFLINITRVSDDEWTGDGNNWPWLNGHSLDLHVLFVRLTRAAD